MLIKRALKKHEEAYNFGRQMAFIGRAETMDNGMSVSGLLEFHLHCIYIDDGGNRDYRELEGEPQTQSQPLSQTA